jgi:hypothetical protein
VRGRRIVIGFAVIATVLALFGAVAPRWLADVAARRLARSLGTDVRLGWIGWNPFSGWWTVRSIRVAADSGPALFSARRVALRVRVWDAVRGRYRVASAEIEGARLRLRATEDGWSLPLPPRDGRETATAEPSPGFELDGIEAPGAVVRLEPLHGRRSLLHLRRLNVSASVDDVTRLTAWTRGRLDRAPVSAVGRIHTSGSAQRVRLRASASDVDVSRALLFAGALPGREVRGRASLHTKYEQSGPAGAVRRAVSGALGVRDLTLGRHGVEGLRVADATLHHFAADLGQHRLSLGRLRVREPEVWLRRTGSQVNVAGLLDASDASAGDDTPPWEITVESAEAVGGAVHHLDAGTGEETLALAVEDAHVGSVAAPDVPVPISFEASVRSGGRVAAEGELVRAPPGGQARVELTGLVLAPLAALVGAPLQLESGQITGAFDVSLSRGVVDGSGTASVTDLKTISPDAAHPEDVMAFKELRLALRRLRTSPPEAALDSLELDWPYVLIDRRPTGIFPLSLAPAFGSSASGRPPFTVRLGRLHVLGGRLDFRDTTIEPPYWRSLAELEADAHRVEGPAIRIGTIRAKGLVDEISPLQVEGTVGDRTQLVAKVERLDLLPFNAYLQGAAPYTVASGSVTGRSEITLERSQLEVNNEVVLSRLGLAGGGGDDFVKREVGIPLTLALALMKDYRGDIALALPFGGDLKEPAFEMRSVVLQAIVQAVRGAVLSPLNALGRVFMHDGRIEEIALQAVPFPPAARHLDEAGRQRLQQVARVLEAHPDLAIRVRGFTATADVERIQDEATLSALGGEPTTDPVPAFLRARLNGGTPPVLDGSQQARLDALRAGLPWPGAELRALALDRGAVTTAALVVDHKIDPQRVTADTPEVPKPEQLAPVGGASVELHER